MPEELHTTEEWVRVLKEQAARTKEYRHNLYEKVDIQNKKRILDVGCGTGVITVDIASLTDGCITGIDIDGKKLDYAKILALGNVNLIKADVLQLPFKDRTFDLVVFNIVLTHIHRQQEAVNEMARVTCENGIVLATMEPDYAGILRYPESEVDYISSKYLEKMGLEMRTGRKLKYLFGKAGLKSEIGVYTEYLDFVNEESEKQVEKFLKNFGSTERLLLKNRWTPQQIEEYKQERLQLIRNNLIFSFIPNFYAIGKKCKLSYSGVEC